MRDHPIPPVTDPLQYRAIGIVRGRYVPKDPNEFTRGTLVSVEGLELEAVVLGRVLNLMKRHLDIQRPHLWVVYPRCREEGKLHLQIAGVWEPSTLGINELETPVNESENLSLNSIDQIDEGDDYFSIRGELIYTRAEAEQLVVKIKQKKRQEGRKNLPFKINVRGQVPLEFLRHFVDLEVRRKGQELCLENFEIIEQMPTRGGKKRDIKQNKSRNY